MAGVLFGNGLFYLLSRYFYTAAKDHGRRLLALFLFLFCMMNKGNLISYVPARTFATHADMATVERGLNISPWWVAIVLGIPFSTAGWHFFAKILREAMLFSFRTQSWGRFSCLWSAPTWFSGSSRVLVSIVTEKPRAGFRLFPSLCCCPWPSRSAGLAAK